MEEEEEEVVVDIYILYCVDGYLVPWGYVVWPYLLTTVSHVWPLDFAEMIPLNWLCLCLQVNFVAAIDVYEDGEAGLLLCYNCESPFDCEDIVWFMSLSPLSKP